MNCVKESTIKIWTVSCFQCFQLCFAVSDFHICNNSPIQCRLPVCIRAGCRLIGITGFRVAGQHFPNSMRPTLSSPSFRSCLHNPLRYVLSLGHLDHPILSRLTCQSAWSQLLLVTDWNLSNTLIS